MGISDRRTIASIGNRMRKLVGGLLTTLLVTGTHVLLASDTCVVRVETDAVHALIPVLSWDTEGGSRAQMNLLAGRSLCEYERAPSGRREKICPHGEKTSRTNPSGTT